MLRTISHCLSFFVATALVISVSAIGAADDDYASAQAYVEVLVTDLVTEVTEHRDIYVNDEKRLHSLIETKIIPSVDVPFIGRLALGKYWKTTSAQKHKLFTDALQSMLTNLYGKSLIVLAEVDSVRFIEPEKTSKGKYQVVASQLIFKGGKPPLEVKYAVKPVDGTWQIFDMVIDGGSILKLLRQNFEQEIAATSLDALITRLSTTHN